MAVNLSVAGTNLRCHPDRLPPLEISQNRVTRSAGGNVLQRMPAQNRADGINRMVVELEELCEGIQHCSDDPIGCAGVFWREKKKQQWQRNAGKKLHPSIKP